MKTHFMRPLGSQQAKSCYHLGRPKSQSKSGDHLTNVLYGPT